MMTMRRPHPEALPARERGAALVIGLLLLAALTLIAIAGLRSAAVELIMSGNAQFYSNAFQASETGIEQSFATGTYNPGAPAQVLQANVPGSATDAYTSTIAPQNGGNPLPALWGNSWNSFSTYHFQVQSVGTAARGAAATHNQGVMVIAPAGPSFSGTGALN
jgi:Tfp pilus assembly protein PilX